RLCRRGGRSRERGATRADQAPRLRRGRLRVDPGQVQGAGANRLQQRDAFKVGTDRSGLRVGRVLLAASTPTCSMTWLSAGTATTSMTSSDSPPAKRFTLV